MIPLLFTLAAAVVPPVAPEGGHHGFAIQRQRLQPIPAPLEPEEDEDAIIVLLL